MWHVFPRNKTLLGKVKSSKTVMAMANVRHTPWRSTFEGHGRMAMALGWISIVFVWYFYDISMVFPWYFYDISMIFRWDYYGIWIFFMAGWWLVYLPPPLKNDGFRQSGWWFFPIWWESHNPVMFQSTRDFMDSMEYFDGIFIEYPLVN